MDERKYITLRAVLLAIDELQTDGKPLAKAEVSELACQYGGRVQITPQEVEDLLKGSVFDIFKIQ